MAKRVLDYDPTTGMTTYFAYDQSADMTTISYSQDVTPILERNKILQNEDRYTKEGIKNEWWHYASIPAILIIKWKQELGVDVFNRDHSRKVFRLLNQPEYRYLKTTTKTHRG